MTLKSYPPGAAHHIRNMDNHFFSESHHLVVISVCHVELKHGELGIVGAVDSFITEIASDFVNSLQISDQQPF